MSLLDKSASKDQLIGILNSMKIPIMGAGGGFAPIGMYGWSPDYVTGAPQGWLRCEGQEVNIADYPELATFYASQHGASNFWGGDGITTFAVPDLRGEFIRGAGTNSHANQGNGGAVGEHQDGTISVGIDRWSNGAGIVTPSYKDADYERNDVPFPSGTIYQELKRNEEGQAGEADNCYTTRPTNTSGVFFVKATLSDTELNNMHVYSPNERKVGWWQEEVDGVLKQKPVYEKKITMGALNITKDTDATVLDVSSYDIDVFITASIRGYESNNIKWTPFGDKGAFSITTNGILRWRSNTNWAFVDSWLIIRYTKTTDQWQTV